MRSIFVPFALLSLFACGEAVSKPKTSPLDALRASATTGTEAADRPIASQPVDVVLRKGQSAMGALERPTALRRFFESLARLEAGQAQQDVRIMQFGDSHTAADIQTAAVRRALQTRFGDGGRGFVAIGRPWKRWVQEGVRVGMSKVWAPEKVKIERGKLTGDGLYGLSGIGLFTRHRGARAWADVSTKASRAELAYLEQPKGGAFDVFVDGARVVRVSTRGAKTASAFRAFDVAEGSLRQVEIRAVGDGDVRVFGMSLERDNHGVVVDALGINGARISTVLSWNEQHWAEQLRHRDPSLVVLAYGTNESTDLEMSQQALERQIVDALGRIARAVPAASCLLLGPPDRAIETKDGWVTAPKMVEIIAAERRVAEAAGCAFYDQFAAMGGEDSIAAWAAEDPPRAQKDRVHLTREGYAQLGSTFASDLMRAYAAWRRESGLPPSATRDVPVTTSSLPSSLDAIDNAP
ncbi:MAG TPA: GDSL-type esterase/lipase family protein [Labilithrix sp.]|nr:GDSL-type esterase/lipase family protein [Labilithrix sp.]